MVEAVGGFWRGIAMVASDEGDDQAVGFAEAKDFGMANDVEGVEFVRFRGDVIADFMYDGCYF